MTLRRRAALLACIATLAAASATAQSVDWPAKTLRIVVPYPPGGSSDIIARSISQAMSEA
ncbi:MAG TPA: tripartite tricarboxylate transporter substrate binding protein, partial [Acidovorax sp.]|nr:tripartite tricarboxylate transporter substrate binding protein [Acidovorax sp.]